MTYHRGAGKKEEGGGWGGEEDYICGVLLKNVVTFGSRRLFRTFSGNGLDGGGKSRPREEGPLRIGRLFGG